jgi:ABC-type nitrate/sulfonate/bicarbonate transport system substrate-binding protein
MKSRTILVLVGIGVATALATFYFYKGTQGSATRSNTVSLRQEWFPNSNYAGALVGAKDFASSNGIKLVVQPGADNIDPVKLVLSGESTFGDAGADRIIAANQKGADLVIIGVLNNDSPTVFLAKEEAKIGSPFDFTGKKIGVLTGTSTEYVYRALLRKLRIDKSSFTEVEAPFDLASFIIGAYDVRPAFIYDEPVSLDIQKIRYSTIRPKDFGISFLGTVYFTRRKFVEEQPELVRAFIRTVAQGWIAALKYPELAIGYLKDFDKAGIDENRELQSLKKSREYFVGFNGQVLRVNPQILEETLRNLRELGVIPDRPITTSVDMRFVEEFHRWKQ